MGNPLSGSLQERAKAAESTEAAPAIIGHATPEGTERFTSRFEKFRDIGSYRRFQSLRLSNIGVGTYLGNSSTSHDSLYARSIARSLTRGANVIDTSIDYRHMRSERTVGTVLRELIGSGRLQRDEVFVSTKGGFLPYDADSGLPTEEYFDAAYFSSGLLSRDEVKDIPHSLKPEFLESQLSQSLRNLGLGTVDLYYIHNPEAQLLQLGREVFLRELEAAFSMLEEKVRDGSIRHYGVATWNGFRQPENGMNFLSLQELLSTAERVGGAEHHFRAIQLPVNLGKTEALTIKCQTAVKRAGKHSALYAAFLSRIGVFAASPLDQGALKWPRLPELETYFAGFHSNAQRAIQFSRSCPGVTCALVGMKADAHVDENLGLLAKHATAPENFVRFFEGIPETKI